MNPFEAILKGADKIINGELPFAPKTANSTSPTAFKVAPASEILNPKPTPAPKSSIFTTKTPAQQVAEVNQKIKTKNLEPIAPPQKEIGYRFPTFLGGEIKPATGKEVKPTATQDFFSGLLGEAQKIVGGDPIARAEAMATEKRTGLQQPFLNRIEDEGLLPSLGKTESEKAQARYDALFESGINTDRAKQIALADVYRNKIDLKNPTQDNRKIYDSLKVTPEEEKAMRWTKVWEVAQLGLDTIGNVPALGSLKFLRNTGKVIAETDDVAKITSELLETGMPENVARKVAPDFVKITDEKKVAQRIEDIATALKADPKAFGEKIVKQYPETVTQIAKLNDPKAIEEILYTTGVERSQIPAMAKVLSNTDNPKRVTNIIEGFTKVPEKKVVLPIKRLETPVESERVQNVLRTKTPEEISNIQSVVSKEKNLVDINTTKFDNVIEDANANRPESYQEILEGWSRGEFKPIEAVKRADGTLFIEDGRHRLLLAQEMGISKYPIKITRNEAKKTPLEVVLSGPSKQKISEVEEKIAKIDEDDFYLSMDLENERTALDTLKEDVSNIDLTMYKRLQAQGLDLESGANRGFIKDKRTGKMKKMRSESFNTVARQLEDLSVELGRKGKEGYIGDAIEMVDDYIARESAYRQQKKIVSERMATLKAEKRALQKEISQVQKSEIQAVESKIKEEKFLNQQAEKTQKMIEEEKIAKIKAENRAIKNEEIKKQLEETQKKLIEEKAYKQRYKEIVSMANRPEFSNNSLGNRLRYAFRKTLFPIKNLDEKTQTVFRDWKRQILVTRELANEQFAKLAIPKEQGMKIINDFQAGRKTEYTDAIKKVFDDLFKQAKEKGFDFRYRENYLPQVYKETPAEIREKLEKYFADQGLDEKMIQDYLDGVIELPEEVMRTLKLNPSFEKQRTFPTYEIAKKYGLTPKYENPAQLASHYKEQMEIALANKNFIKKLEAEGKVLPEADAPRTWDEIKLKLDGGRYFAKPEFAEIINGQLREADKLGVFDLAVKGVAKTSKLMQEIALSAGVPKSSFNFFSIGQAVKALTAGDVKMAGEVLLRSNFNKASIKFFQENADVIKEMASEGIDVSKRIGDYKDMYESLVDKLSRKEYREAVGVGFSDLFNEKTFSSFMPQMQISNYKQVYAKAIKDGMTPEQARAFSADVTRKFFGLFEDVGRSDATNDGLTALFFAPRFREGMINVLMNNLKSVTTELRNPIYYKNRRLVVGMTLTYAMYNAINKELNGNYMWENEPGKEFALKMPYGNGQFVYLEFMPSFLAFARSLASGFYNLGTGNTGVATQKLGSVFSMPIKTTTDIISNSDYFDRPIYKESDEGTVKAEKIAKYAGLSFAHPYVKELIKQIDEKNKVPLWQSLSIAMELPLKYSNQQKINTAKYYENLNNFNKQNAQIKDRNQKEFQPTFDKVQKLKEEGKIEEAKAIVDALSDYEYDFYKTMLKSVKAKETNTKKVEILPLYEQVQQLKDQGRIEEASEIVDSLSEEDYKAYSSLKKSFSTKPEISVSDN